MLDKISLVLVIIGALNWGGIGLFQFDSQPYYLHTRCSCRSLVHFTLVQKIR